MLEESDIKHIAKLARIELSAGDIEKFKRELSSVLGYVEQLQQIDTSSVQPLYQTSGRENMMRPDEPRGAFPADGEHEKLLIQQAPKQQERFIKVRSVFKK